MFIFPFVSWLFVFCFMFVHLLDNSLIGWFTDMLALSVNLRVMVGEVESRIRLLMNLSVCQFLNLVPLLIFEFVRFSIYSMNFRWLLHLLFPAWLPRLSLIIFCPPCPPSLCLIYFLVWLMCLLSSLGGDRHLIMSISPSPYHTSIISYLVSLSSLNLLVCSFAIFSFFFKWFTLALASSIGFDRRACLSSFIPPPTVDMCMVCSALTAATT